MSLSGASAAPALVPQPVHEPDQPAPGQPAADPGPHLRVVAARSRSAAARRRQARFLCIVASAAVVFVAFGLVYLHVLSAQKQFEINRLTVTERTAQAEYQRLRVAVETENSPARIMAAAERLGMTAPAGVTVLKAPRTTAPSAIAPGAIAPGGIANFSKEKSNLSGNP